MKYFEKLGSSFMSHYARRLADLINEQAAEVLTELKLNMPSSAISTVQFINQNTDVTVAHIADALGVTHQMASQRVNALVKLNLVKRTQLANDHRSKQIILSSKGVNEYNRLQPFMQKMSTVFDELEAELGHKLSQQIYQAEISLRNKPLLERYEAK